MQEILTLFRKSRGLQALNLIRSPNLNIAFLRNQNLTRGFSAKPVFLQKSQSLPAWLLAAPLLLLLALQLAYWTWAFARPVTPLAPRSSVPAATAVNIDAILQSGLFGSPQSNAPVAAAEVPAIPVELQGVFSGSGRSPGYAILNVQGTPQIVRENGEIASGIKLLRVDPDRVTILRGDQEETLEFPTTAGSPPADASAAEAPAATQPTTITVPRALINSAMRDPAQWIRAGVLAPNPGGGLKVVSVAGGGLYQRLGLQGGDVIQSINGQPVTSPDQALTQARNGASAGSLRIDVLRNGSVQQLNYSFS